MTDLLNLLNAIDLRRSRRKYLPALMKQADVEMLSSFISDFNAKEQAKMRLVLDNGDAFNGFRKSYGMLSGVKNYVALICDATDTLQLEKLGYYGELLILHATSRGLGTCWVGGTFDRDSCNVELKKGESIVCAITVGNVKPRLSAKEKLIRGLTHRKSKTIEQMYTSDSSTPDWFLSGMDAVQKAPSAINRQPVMFSYIDGTVTASVEDIDGEGFAFDLGIAKLHFEIGAGGGTWEFGNGGRFKVND
jgi:hypothetical protein